MRDANFSVLRVCERRSGRGHIHAIMSVRQLPPSESFHAKPEVKTDMHGVDKCGWTDVWSDVDEETVCKEAHGSLNRKGCAALYIALTDMKVSNDRSDATLRRQGDTCIEN